MCLAIAAALLLAAPTRQPVVAVLPLRTSAELAPLGLLIDARASALLANSGAISTLDMKQVLAMAGQEGLDPATLADEALADSARELLGADSTTAVTLSGGASGFVLQGSVRDGQHPTPFSVKAQGSWVEALEQGSNAIAGAVLAHVQRTLAADAKAQPESRSEAALHALGACWETALRQPMGLDAPVGLSNAELQAAVSGCRAALKADPSLRFAEATLGLLQAIAREDAEAEKLLGPPADSDPALTPWVLARFWLLTRHHSAEAAVAFLSTVGAKYPGVLLLRSLRASALASMNEHPRAVAAWNEYLALAPTSAFALGRASRSLARQEKVELALATATKGLRLAPRSREARLALAARQLDAKQLDLARATLEPLVALPHAPAEPLLHLGLAYQAAGDTKAAAPLFKLAAEHATGPRGWKTRDRALAALVSLGVEPGHPAAPQPASIGGLYAKVAPLEAKVVLTAAASELADSVLHDKLTGLGATFAPGNEDKATALAVVKAHGLKGYELRVTLQPGADAAGLKVDLLVLSYPEQALKGSWSVKASKGKQESLVKAMLARVVDDAAGDLDWRN